MRLKGDAVGREFSSITARDRTVSLNEKRGFPRIPILRMLIGQLNLAGRVIGGADEFAVLIDLPDILGRVIIKYTAGGSGGEPGRAGGYTVCVSGT